jgi:hypothetical protein
MANDTTVKRAAKKAAPALKAVKKPAARKATPPRPAPLPPAGWYPDPAEPGVERYWDGDGWDARKGQRRLGDEPAPVTADPAAEEDNGGQPDPTGTITFRGRVMAFQRPNVDQLAVWKMIADRAERVGRELTTPKPCPGCQGKGCDECQGTGSAHTATIFKLFNRAMAIISSVLTDEADKDWLEDELIAGRVDIQAASEIIALAVTAMVAAKPAAPTTGPAPKARRRR